MKIKVFIKAALLLVFGFYSFVSNAQKEKDPLNKRVFNLSLNEIKDGQPQNHNSVPFQ